MKRVISYFLPFLALVLVFMIPYSFIMSSRIRGVLDRVLHIEVDPVFSGGEVLAKFMDPAGDDNGEGSLTYPRHPGFKGGGLLDVVRYTVYRPVVQGRWTEGVDFWQLGVTFNKVSEKAGGGAFTGQPVLNIYIDLDGPGAGSMETAQPRTELVTFDNRHPWDVMVHVDGFSGRGYMRFFDSPEEKDVFVFYLAEKKTVYLRLPLEGPRLKSVLDGRTTYHYVLAGAYDPMARGGFMQVKKTAGQRNGGGAASELTPRVYDWVAPRGTAQRTLLSGYNEETFEYAALPPLEVKEQAPGDNFPAEDVLEEYRKKLAQERKNRKKIDHEAVILELKQKGEKGLNLAKAYLGAGQYQEAETLLARLVAQGSKDPEVLIYQGTVAASMAGKARSPARAMQLVNRAFQLYGKALPLCRTDGQRLTLRLHRGNVSISIPNDVFQKTVPGIEDLLKAVEIIETTGQLSKQRKLVIECYMKAALAYERVDRPGDAEIYFTRLLDFKPLPTATVVKLLERGYNEAVAPTQ